MNFRTLFWMSCLIALVDCSRRTEVNSESQAAAHDGNGNQYKTKLMLDGKLWLAENLNLKMSENYCQQNDTSLCEKYGTLYTWKTAQKVCGLLGDGWRLPTDEEWQTMAKFYGGIYDDSNDQGKSAYVRLMEGGNSGFNATLGGNREANGNYERLDAHGFYWTSSEYDSTNAWFYNFGKSSTLLNHHTGDKRRAISVRCIRDSVKNP